MNIWQAVSCRLRLSVQLDVCRARLSADFLSVNHADQLAPSSCHCSTSGLVVTWPISSLSSLASSNRRLSPLMGTENYSAHRTIWSWYTGRWRVGCYIWYSEEGTGRGPSPPSPLLAAPNVTAHPSTASVSTSYYSMCTTINPCAH